MVHSLHAHVLFAPKYRRGVFTDELLRLEEIMIEVYDSFAAPCGGAPLPIIKEHIETPGLTSDRFTPKGRKRFLPGENRRGCSLDSAELHHAASCGTASPEGRRPCRTAGLATSR
ncbi:hypothetical protein EDD27_1306 [Nonomuraea polychroma]|uniref:Transposase IS200 family protein n=1 Tax=Nonomuraea polychroma TaxID=46176 RepID=A0A438LZH9_9ACTN|nr:hypothetical protein EDD27_1306 [Nonomuraea polychroma]